MSDTDFSANDVEIALTNADPDDWLPHADQCNICSTAGLSVDHCLRGLALRRAFYTDHVLLTPEVDVHRGRMAKWRVVE